MKKLSIIVPYRNREEHLFTFSKEMPKFLKDLNYDIVIVEQFDKKPFNRAKLLNIGFDFKKDHSDYFCFHDIDLVPENSDYSYCENPTHLSTYCSQFNYKIPYENIFGGVTMFNKDNFIKVNGYSNNFWGWGGEDDDMFNRIKQGDYQIDRRKGVYKSLNHSFNGPNHENYQNNVKKLSDKYDYITDGINTLTYELISVDDIGDKIKLIKVNL